MTETAKRNWGITKVHGRKHVLDKFYTKPEIAAWCIQQLDLSTYDLIIEPSAGSGSFSSQIPNCLAMDHEPEGPGIIKQDWFAYNLERDPNRRTLIIGNPPFGQKNSLAVKFINHGAKFADTIAFILPMSFMKESLQNMLNANYHLSAAHPLPRYGFTLNGEDMHVPCVFQVWDYNPEVTRTPPVMPKPVGFEFVPKTAEPDLYLQRVGGRAGEVGTAWEHKNAHSHYFIKMTQPHLLADLVAEFGQLTFPHRKYSVGPRSVGKKEILLELAERGSSFVQA